MEGGSSSFGNPGARGGGGQKTMPSVVGVWIFSGITHCTLRQQNTPFQFNSEIKA